MILDLEFVLQCTRSSNSTRGDMLNSCLQTLCARLMLVFLQPPDLGIAHEQASTDATRPARADAINTGSSSITHPRNSHHQHRERTGHVRHSVRCRFEGAPPHPYRGPGTFHPPLPRSSTHHGLSRQALCEKAHVDGLKRLTDDAEEKRRISYLRHGNIASCPIASGF